VGLAAAAAAAIVAVLGASENVEPAFAAFCLGSFDGGLVCEFAGFVGDWCEGFGFFGVGSRVAVVAFVKFVGGGYAIVWVVLFVVGVSALLLGCGGGFGHKVFYPAYGASVGFEIGVLEMAVDVV